MGSSSAVVRLICRKGFAAGSPNISWNRTAGCRSNWFINGLRRQMSTTTTLQNPAAASSPWLMLPPASDGSYNFYSLADNKVITLSDHGHEELGGGGGFTTTTADVANKLKCRGSSRGWLVLVSPHNLDLYLFNPISRRHIKLPPIRNLPVHPDEESTSRGVAKVVLSCSPDEDEENCRAAIIHNNCLLASCCPGRSNEWTQFGRTYLDCAYSAAQKVLFSLTWDDYLETWDLGDPSSPRLINKVKTKPLNSCMATSLRVTHSVGQVEHLVVVAGEQDDDLLRVNQYTIDCAPDGSFCARFDERSKNCPLMTIDFTVHRYDPEKGDFKHVDRWSLGGLSLFVGIDNQSGAFQAASDQYPELKPNSIYFTDTYSRSLDGEYYNDRPFGGQDIGIFNYEDKTVSPCYYPCDVQSLKKIVPPPMWFFPSRFI